MRLAGNDEEEIASAMGLPRNDKKIGHREPMIFRRGDLLEDREIASAVELPRNDEKENGSAQSVTLGMTAEWKTDILQSECMIMINENDYGN